MYATRQLFAETSETPAEIRSMVFYVFLCMLLSKHKGAVHRIFANSDCPSLAVIILPY
jgi:hypothetical protein